MRRYAVVLACCTFGLVIGGALVTSNDAAFPGIGAYMARIAYAGAPQPMPLIIWFTVAHVAAGSFALGAAVALAMIVYRHPRLTPVLAHGGIVIA